MCVEPYPASNDPTLGPVWPNGVIRGYGNIADHLENIATPDCVSSDHRDDWLGQPTDLNLQVEHVEASHPIRTHVAAFATDALIPATAERQVPCPGEDDDTDLGVIPGVRQAQRQLLDRERCESIPLLRSVDGEFRDALALGFSVDHLL